MAGTGTPFSSIYDLFLQLVTDYRLIVLYNSSQDDLETYLESWLVLSVYDFSSCNQDLTYDTTTRTFTETLSQENINVLARLMVKYWLEKEVQDVTQMSLHVQDRDFKTYAEGQNLKEKTAHLDRVKEECSQLLNDYSYKNNDWSSWFSGSFSGS